MKIKYTHDSLSDKEKDIKQFNSRAEFINHRQGKIFKQLLEENRINSLDKITINLSYPAVITIEFIRE